MPDHAGQTKQQRQVAKLNAAQTKRQNVGTPGYRYLNTYDINTLPTKYSGVNVVNNANSGGLVAHRPWTSNT